MKGINSSFAIAAGISLVFHAALVLILLRFEPTPPGDRWTRREAEEQRPIILEPEPQADPPSEVRRPVEFEMGDQAGRGDASHDLPAPVEAIAPEADSDQAFLSLDPAGTGDSGSDATAVRVNGEGSVRGQSGGNPPQPPLPVVETLASAAVPTFQLFAPGAELKLPRGAGRPVPADLVGSTSAHTQAPAASEQPAPELAPTPPPPASQPVVVAAVAPPQAEAPPTTSSPPSPATGGSTRGVTEQPAADPARMAESESDPFSRLGTVTFTEGALQIRFGRKVKTRKPKLLIAGQIDLLSLQRARVVLKIDIDETGKVTGVNVVKSSGSNEIDQPTRVAVYDWWFEPKKDANGIPVADQVQFTIAWR